jgi:hypothetical protein
MNHDSSNSHNDISDRNLSIMNINKKKIQRTRVLSTKVTEEDYGAYKIAADELFEGSNG